jgi:hypothetical protein
MDETVVGVVPDAADEICEEIAVAEYIEGDEPSRVDDAADVRSILHVDEEAGYAMSD